MSLGYMMKPRTDVRVTKRRGEFLLQAEPRVSEPEYQMTRRVVRGEDREGDSAAAPKAARRGGADKKGQS